MTKNFFRIVTATWFIASVGCASGQGYAVDMANLPKIGVDYQLTDQDICRGKGSPEIRLTDLPAGVVSYDVRMTDLDAPRFKHWNETIQFQERAIPAGKGAN